MEPRPSTSNYKTKNSNKFWSRQSFRNEELKKLCHEWKLTSKRRIRKLQKFEKISQKKVFSRIHSQSDLNACKIDCKNFQENNMDYSNSKDSNSKDLKSKDSNFKDSNSKDSEDIQEANLAKKLLVQNVNGLIAKKVHNIVVQCTIELKCKIQELVEDNNVLKSDLKRLRDLYDKMWTDLDFQETEREKYQKLYMIENDKTQKLQNRINGMQAKICNENNTFQNVKEIHEDLEEEKSQNRKLYKLLLEAQDENIKLKNDILKRNTNYQSDSFKSSVSDIVTSVLNDAKLLQQNVQIDKDIEAKNDIKTEEDIYTNEDLEI